MDFNIQKNKNTVFLNESLPFVQSGDVDWLLLEGSSRSAKTWGIEKEHTIKKPCGTKYRRAFDVSRGESNIKNKKDAD